MEPNPPSIPTNVGILAMEIYFPRYFVDQEKLEQHDNVSKGKYTIGLSQSRMAFLGDREDICSMCSTVVRSLMEKYKIDYQSIGRLEVGTESQIDKSKSVKTFLMQLFSEHGNTDIEGIDTVNACYGGTAALFNALHWVDSNHWDGRLAIVVAADISVYAPGPARPTGGCGAIAMLIGRDAPIVIQPGLRGVHMEHAYDFYKPTHQPTDYPIVDGHYSVECYLRALDVCYKRFKEKYQQKYSTKHTMELPDYALFHSPYCKLVQKAVARLLFNDFLDNPDDPKFESVKKFQNITTIDSYTNRDLDVAFVKLSENIFKTKSSKSLTLSRELGNMYCGALYSCLLSLICQHSDEELVGKSVLMFSYGSGLASTMFSIIIRKSVSHIAKQVNITERLAQRVEKTPVEFEKAVNSKEELHKNIVTTAVDPLQELFPRSYYLTHIDAKSRRFYAYHEG